MPEDLQISHRAFVREFNMQTGAPLLVGSTRAKWNATVAVARKLAATYDPVNPLTSPHVAAPRSHTSDRLDCAAR